MSLSDVTVQNLLAKEFISAWVNTEGDRAAGGSFAHSPTDAPGSCVRGNGRANLQLLALTPDGRIFHAIAGYVAPVELAAELEWALETWRLIKTVPTLERAMVEERARDYATAGPRLAATEGLFGDGEARDAFRQFIERGITRDTRFVEEHPLMPIAEFRTSMLGEGGASFFGSSGSARPGATIGNVDAGTRETIEATPEELRKKLEELRRAAEK